MKRNKYKQIFLALAILIVSFVVSRPALAEDTYISVGQNGSIISIVDIIPGTTLVSNTSFKVSGTIFSSSTTPEKVSLTATNNGIGSPVTLIASQSINPSKTITSGIVSGFTAPVASGNYAVQFVTNVDITVPTTANLLPPFYVGYQKITGATWAPNGPIVCLSADNSGLGFGGYGNCGLGDVNVVYQYSAVAGNAQEGVVCLDNAIDTASILTVKWKDSYDNLQHTFKLKFPAGDRCTSSSNYPPIPLAPSLFPFDYNINFSYGFPPIYIGHTFTGPDTSFTISDVCIVSNNPAVTIPTSLKCN
jgi:hypothetical protein